MTMLVILRAVALFIGLPSSHPAFIARDGNDNRKKYDRIEPRE